MAHSVMLALPAFQVTPCRHGQPTILRHFRSSILLAVVVCACGQFCCPNCTCCPVIHGACKGPRDGSQGQGCESPGCPGWWWEDRKNGPGLDWERTGKGLGRDWEGTGRTDRTAFVTCHAALVQPLCFLCVLHLTWVRRCRTPLHSCQKRAWVRVHSTVQLGKPAAP